MKTVDLGMQTAAIVMCFACAAYADVYQWNASVQDGSWSTPGNWTSDTGSNYPGWSGSVSDSVNLPDGTYTIRLSNDVTISQLGRTVYGASSGVKTLDAGGKTVNVTASGVAGYFLAPDCSTFVFLNGTLVVEGSGFSLGGNTSSSTGALVIDDAEYTGKVAGSRGCQFVIRNGGVYHPVADWKFPTMLGLNSNGGFVRVTGSGSRIDGQNYSLNLNTKDFHQARFEVLDGATASVNNLTLGADASGATNVVAVADNGEIQVCGYLRIGMDAQAVTYGHELHISGERGCVNVAGELKIMQLDDNRLYFTPGPRGFIDALGVPRSALSADSLSMPNRTKGPQNVYTRLFVNPERWMRVNPGETIELIRLANPNAAALQVLADHVVFEMDHPEYFSGNPVVRVSADGCALMMTGADLAVELSAPEFESECVRGESDGTEIVNVLVTDYGTLGEAASVSVTRADDMEKLGTGEAVDVAKDVFIASTLPARHSFDIVDLGKDASCYVRIVVTNDLGVAATNDLHFISSGDCESFEQKTAVSAVWQDSSAWIRTDTGATSGGYPMPDDTVHLVGGATTVSVSPYTLTLSDHAGCAYFLKQDGITDAYLQFTLSLNGYDFFVSDKVNPWASIYCYQPQSLELKDLGRWICLKGPGIFDASKNPGLNMSQSGATGSCGELRLEDGVVYNGAVNLMNNGSRVFVRGGSVWQATSDFTWQNTKAPHGYVCVSGALSRVSAKAYTYTAGNTESGFFVIEGGLMEVGAMNIGTGNFDGTFLRLDSGHLKLGALSVGGADNAGKNARVDIAGQSSVLISGGLSLYDRQGTVVAISIPEEGYSAPLIEAERLVVGVNSRGDSSATELLIDSRNWAKLHPDTELVLIELQQRNLDGLNSLAERVSFVGNGRAFVIVNETGTKLSIRSAKKRGFTMVVR